MSDGLQKKLDEQLRRSVEKRPADVNDTIAGAIQDLRDSGIVDQARGVGDRAPSFSLPGTRGTLVSLGDLLGRGPVVLAFYRGGW